MKASTALGIAAGIGLGAVIAKAASRTAGPGPVPKPEPPPEPLGESYLTANISAGHERWVWRTYAWQENYAMWVDTSSWIAADVLKGFWPTREQWGTNVDAPPWRAVVAYKYVPEGFYGPGASNRRYYWSGPIDEINSLRVSGES